MNVFEWHAYTITLWLGKTILCACWPQHTLQLQSNFPHDDPIAGWISSDRWCLSQ